MTIQSMIEAAQPGDTVVAPGGTFTIDALDDHDVLWVRKSLTLDLRAATFLIKPNGANDRVYFAIGITGQVDVTILLGGIRGDRNGHIGDTPAGQGHGIAIDAGAKVKLVGGTISDCMGDGVCVFYAGNQVVLEGVTLTHNRRQGMSAASVDYLHVSGCQFTGNGGISPGAGIDLEPDPGIGRIHNVLIENNLFSGNAGPGVLLACPPALRSNVHVMPNNVFNGCPIDGSDGVVPFPGKLLRQAFSWWPNYNWWYYPRELHI